MIIPTYQEEKIIEKQLKRFTRQLRQKYAFEVIVSDGGSTDSTASLASPHCDKLVIHNEKRRQTISEGRNKGAEVALGEIFVFMNIDSFPDDMDRFFSFLIKWFKDEKMKKYGAIACKVLPCPDEKKFIDKVFYFLINNYFSLLNTINIGMGRGECQIIRREIFEKEKGYNIKFVAGEDYDLYRRIAKISKIYSDGYPIIYESPRRFREEGYLPVLGKWFLNSMSITILNKSMSKEWKAVR